MATTVQTEHPYITRRAGVCGGSPIVAGRRIPVWQIAYLLQQGRTAEEIVEEYLSRLGRAAVYDAISYYYDHQDEVDRDVWLNTSDEALSDRLEKLGASQGTRGAIRFRSSTTQ